MPHSFSNSERIRRQIKELVEQKRGEQPTAKSEDRPRKGKKKQKSTR